MIRPLMVSLQLLGVALAAVASNTPPSAELILVVGAPGTPEFGQEFQNWAGHWTNAAALADVKQTVIGLEPNSDIPDRVRLEQALANAPKESPEPLWLVLIGHGTFDGKEAKFNLRGNDFSAADCASWLEPFKRTLAIINCSSSSGPFIAQLSAPNRVVVTATRSGFEQNYSRFGKYFAEALATPSADLDKDNQISVLEAFLSASDRVADFYQSEGRLATEHALIDDTGDKRGTPADWFRGVRAVKKADDGAEPDGRRAHLLHLIRSADEQALPPQARARRDELELALAKLRDQKLALGAAEYLRQLEEILIEIAQLYESADSAEEVESAQKP